MKPLIQGKNSKKHELVFSEAEKITVTSGTIKKEFCADKVFDQSSTQGVIFILGSFIPLYEFVANVHLFGETICRGCVFRS